MGPAGAYFKHAMERMEQEKPGVRYIVFTNDMERAEEALAPVLESQKKDAVGQAENRLEFVSEMGEFSDVDEFFLMAHARTRYCPIVRFDMGSLSESEPG